MARKKIILKTIEKSSLFLIVLSLVFILYSSRQIFSYRYEPEYYENWYYNSQWNVPQSTRGISDGELYKFVGYRLTEGENPFNINYEVPPFAKYLYGLAEKYIGNPYYISIGLYLLSLYTLFLSSRLLFKKKVKPTLLLFLFISSPFVATQIRETMLDLPLTAMFLLHLYFFIRHLSSKNKKDLILSGIFLGLATGTKIGIYTAPIIFLSSFLIFFPKKLFLNFIIHNLSIFGGYILAFISYFLRHPNPIPWLRLHEKVLGFYLQNKPSPVDHLNQWKGIFLNSYQGFWEGASRTTFGDWSPLLPIGVISAFIILLNSLKKKDKKWFYISSLCLIFLFINSLVPLFPRYLMPCIPIFVLLVVHLFKRKPLIIFFLALLNLPFLINSFPLPKVEGDVLAFSRFFSTRAYRELYRSIDPHQREELPEKYFIDGMEYFFDTLNTRKIEFQTEETYSNKNQAQINSKITYETKYGLLKNDLKLRYVKRNNQWKAVWEWDYLWPGYSPNLKIVIDEKDIPLNKLILNEKQSAYKDSGKTVYMIPRLMFDWCESTDLLAKLTAQNSQEVNQIIRKSIPDDYPRFVGYLDPNLDFDNPETKKFLSYPGVSLRDNLYFSINSQVKNKALISRTLVNLQKQHPEYFYTKAEIYIENNNQKVKLPFEIMDQENITVSL